MIKILLNRIAHIKQYMKEKEQVLLLRGEEIDTVNEALHMQEKLHEWIEGMKSNEPSGLLTMKQVVEILEEFEVSE